MGGGLSTRPASIRPYDLRVDQYQTLLGSHDQTEATLQVRDFSATDECASETEVLRLAIYQAIGGGHDNRPFYLGPRISAVFFGIESIDENSELCNRPMNELFNHCRNSCSVQQTDEIRFRIAFARVRRCIPQSRRKDKPGDFLY